MVILGELSLWMALLMSLWSAVVLFLGARQSRASLLASGQRAVRVALAFLALAGAALLSALLTRDLSVAYVSAHVSSVQPAIYAIPAMWAGPAGSLLLCTTLLAAAANLLYRTAGAAARPAVTTLSVLIALCAALMVTDANPFERLPWVPPDGQGLRPDLQTVAFSLYPPVLYAGLVASAVPFSLRLNNPVSPDPGSLHTRRWLAVAWILLLCGILGGLWWEFSIRGWASTWQLQPLRNSTVLAWIAVTTLAIRARTGYPADRGLSATALLLAVFAGVTVTSEHSSSVEAFARSPVATLLLIVVIAGVSLSAIHQVSRGPSPSSERAVQGTPWRGALPVVLGGLLLFAAGLTASAFRSDFTVSMAAGGQVSVADPFDRTWRFTSAGVSRYEIGNRSITAVALSVFRDGGRAVVISAERRQYFDGRRAPTFPPTPAAGALHTVAQTIQAALIGSENDDAAVLALSFHPLALLTWVGGALLAIAGFVFFWPARGSAS